MSYRAWAYIWSVLLAGITLSVLSFAAFAPSPSGWIIFAVLTVFATLAQLFKAEAPSHQLYHATPIFMFASLLLLPPFFFILLVLISFLTEWAKERLVKSEHLRSWYLQPFNIAMYITAGMTAQWVYNALNPSSASFLSPVAALAATIAALTYVALNHVLVGLALILARGVSWRESGVLDIENLLTEIVLLCLGVIVAVLATLNPWLIPLALSPLVLIYRALTVPQLKQEAQTDGKTGLLNARHFARLFEEEFNRARRFNRPLALIMADLDLLRDVNNTYGHLAGDAVLTGIGQIIRKLFREYDIAGRFGGEEFAIVLPEVEQAEACRIAERLRGVIAEASFEIATSPSPIRVTMSLGVACFPQDAVTTTDLTHAADVAVYQAKLRGRNQVICASEVSPAAEQEYPNTAEREPTPYAAAFAPIPKKASSK